MKTSYRQQENEGDTKTFKVRLPVADGRVAVFLFPELEGRRRELLRVVKKKNKIRIYFPAKALLRLLLRAIGID